MCTFMNICLAASVGVLTLLCVLDAASGCDPWEFRCDNSECVRGGRRCNGVSDCGDSSDEKHCPTPPPAKSDRFCAEGQFCCTNGRTIYLAWRCDGDADCPDGSDEVNCPTSAPRPIPTTTITIGITASASTIVVFLCCLYFYYHRRKHPRPPPPPTCLPLPVPPPTQIFPPPQYGDHLHFPQAAVVNVSLTYNNIGRPPPLYTSHVNISDTSASAPYDGVIEPPPEYEPPQAGCLGSECGRQHMAGRQTRDMRPGADDPEKQCVSGQTVAGGTDSRH